MNRQSARCDGESLEQLLRRARREAAEIGSVREGVVARLETVGVPPRRSGARLVIVAMAAILLAAGVWVGLSIGRRDTPHEPTDMAGAEREPPVARIEVGDIAVTVSVAAMVDPRTVLVVWSAGRTGLSGCSGDPQPAAEEDPGPGRYTCAASGTARDRRGDRVFYSVLVATGDTAPILEPPTLVVRTGANQTMAFRVQPSGLAGCGVASILDRAGVGPAAEIVDAVRATSSL